MIIRLKKVFSTLFWLSIFCASGGVMVAAAAFLYLSPQLPSAESYRHVQLETPLRILTADNRLIDLENLRDEDLEELRATFERVARSRGVSIEDLILRRDDQT